MKGAAVLEARDLHFGYPGAGAAVLAGVSLALRPGEVVALLGANGSGKSTLLRLLLGLLRPGRGTLCLEGRPWAAWRRRERARRVAYVPQIHQVPFPYLVRDLVALGRIPQRGLLRTLGADDRDAVARALERLHITHLAERPYHELSGGERQLCLIARALVQEAQVIVMDEPVTGLDYGHQWRLLALIRELAAAGRAVIMSTHYPDHALNAANRVLLLHAGRLAADGPPEAVVTPANLLLLTGLAVSAHRIPGGPLALVPELVTTWRAAHG
ncbi:ABC transporter ATP-binding protein [Candidatus Thiodictyon syntrophicum]|jgi:iron complex transport system ATP-binding protein|uniref:ABC transporter domain-containing protein n=1 Tax=Candidatus Thiodictyon syntrophicum TaxID=1166950 RepID=A0A2K8U8A1_9GAMM|nr:ABC transporter ATP-binding protein [Candidatus Thiodictyon syntrophicum]AUB81777.1 hypothetical protein THSYN_12930 [Candidatus Thiodictyon syntrophicum]